MKRKKTISTTYILILYASTLLLCNSILYAIDSNTGPDIPTAIIENKGQLSDTEGRPCDEILFYASMPGMDIFFRSGGVSYVLKKMGNDKNGAEIMIRERIDMNFEGASANCRLEGFDHVTAVNNYYLSHCPDGITGVKSYKSLRYRNIYDGIDITFDCREMNIKYDFIVHPGADYRNIRINYEGMDELEIPGKGFFSLHTKTGQLNDHVPFTYVADSTNRQEVDAKYILDNNSVKFDVGEYDRSKSLVIDPILMWSTYYGGTDGDHAKSMDMDLLGNVVLTGYTLSKDFPTTVGAEQRVRAGFYDAFLMQMTDDGSIIWATYFGGEETDLAQDIAADNTLSLFVTGYTWSKQFPVTPGAVYNYHSGPFPRGTDGFISRFNNDGELVWSTYYGGVENEHFYGIAANGNGEIALAGWTESFNFILDMNPVYNKNPTEKEDAFLMTMDTDGNPQWVTFLGGDSSDAAFDVIYDNRGYAVITGYTNSRNFQLVDTSASDRDLAERYDAFVACFNTSTTISSVQFSKIYGGSDNDDGYAIAVDENNQFYFGGATNSLDYHVTTGAVQGYRAGLDDAFLTKVDQRGNILWSTYFGGNDDDIINDLIIDNEGNLLVTGTSASNNLYTTRGAIQPEFGGPEGGKDAFAIKYLPDGSDILWSTYIGGNDNDWGWAITHDNALNALVAGATSSRDFPSTGAAVQPEFKGIVDAFILKLCKNEPNPQIGMIGTIPFCIGDSVILVASDGFRHYMWSNGMVSQKITVKKPGDYYVLVTDSAGCKGYSDTITVELYSQPEPEITGDLKICEGEETILTLLGEYDDFIWGNGSRERSITVDETGYYSVSVVDSNGCSGSDSVMVIVHENPEPLIHGPKTVCYFSKGIVYYIHAIAESRYTWKVNGGTFNYGVDSVNITVDWGGSGIGIITVIEENMETGCIGYDTLEVLISEQLRPKIISNIGDFEICDGDTIILDAGEGYYKYTWSTGETRRQIEVTKSGEYWVIVKDLYQCEGTDTAEVIVHPNPEPLISGPQEVCEFEEGVVYSTPETAGNSYTWTISGGEISSGENSPEIEINWFSAGTGSLKVRELDNSSGCQGETTAFEVTIHPNPEPVIEIFGETEFCEGGSVDLDAGSGYSEYLWTNGETTQRINVTQSGEYSVTVTDANGCTGISDESVSITVWPLPPVPVITLDDPDLVCSDAYSYQWYLDGQPIPGAVNKRYTPQQTGEYHVVITDEHGCSSVSETLEIWRGFARVDIKLPDTTFANTGDRVNIPIRITDSKNLDKVEAWDFIAYMRYNRSVLLPVADYPLHEALAREDVIKVSGTRITDIGEIARVEFHTAWGDAICSEVTLDSLVFEGAPVDVFIEPGVFCLENLCEAGDSTRLFISGGEQYLLQNIPNPFSGSTIIRFEIVESGRTRLFVTNLMGREVAVIFDGRLERGEHSFEFMQKELPSGVYFYSLQTPSSTLTRKMEIIK